MLPHKVKSSLLLNCAAKAGTKINVIDTGEAKLQKPVTEDSLNQFQVWLKGKGVLKTLLEERRTNAERE